MAGVSGAFGNNSAVTTANLATAAINLQGFNTQIGSLAGGGSIGGNVALGSARLTLGGDNTSTAYAGAISGTGSLTKIGSGVQTLSGTSNYSGVTTVSAGVLAVNGQIGSAVGITSGGTLAGTGTVAGSLSGAGIVSPGLTTGSTTTGILRATIFNPGTGLGAAFEFTAASQPNYSSPTSSINDVLRLTATDSNPFASNAFSSANPINLYFNVDSIAPGATFTGGYLVNYGAGDAFTDPSELVNVLSAASYHYYVKSSTGTAFNGVNYTLLSESESNAITRSALEVPDIGGGLSGFITQFNFASLSANNSSLSLPSTPLTLNVRPGSATTGSTTVTNSGVDTSHFTLTSTGSNGLTINPANSTAIAGGPTTSSATVQWSSTATAGSRSGQITLTNTDNSANPGTPTTQSVSGGVYDFASAKYDGIELAFGNIHQGAVAPAAQTVAIGNQTVSSASFQDSLNASASTDNARVTATGFTGLAASLSGSSTNNLSIAVSTASAGSLASTLSLTLVSNANGVSGLSNGTATTVGGGSITTSGTVYSGLSTWITNGSGAWGTLTGSGSDTFGSNWNSGGSAGLDSNFQSSDTATFGSASTSGTSTVALDGALVSLKEITFDNSVASYTLAKGTGSGTLTLNSGSNSASVTVSSGSHAISANIALASNLNVSVANSGDQLTQSGVLSGSGKTLTKSGLGTLVLSAANTFSGSTTVSAGTLNVVSASALATSSVTVSSGATLSLAPAVQAVVTGLSVAGKVNLNTGRVTIAAGGMTESDLRAAVIAGRNNGTWNGTSGIESSAAAIANGTRAVGYKANGSGSLTVAFSAQGDTNLDGFVNLTDLSSILASGKYNTGATANWAQGDFNYDGVANLTDLSQILSTGLYNQGSYLSYTPASNQAGGLNGDPSLAGGLGMNGGMVVVPEPSTAVLVGIGMALACLGLRNRRRMA